jgi:ABC-type branched-subunit amino acid transport system substrate-binding protein
MGHSWPSRPGPTRLTRQGNDGHQVQLYIEDDAGNTATSVSEVKRHTEQDHLVAIIGQAARDADAWAGYVKQQGIPVVGAYAPG